MRLERSSGILVHISCLPSKYGIGDLGPEAYRFIDFLVETKQKLWQILPLNPTNSPSPYSSISTFAGNSWFISPDKLIEENLLNENDLKLFDQNEFVNFKLIKQFKENCLQKAFDNFQKKENYESILNQFYENEKNWIDDWILFLTIKEKFENVIWSDWPKEYRHRHLSILQQFRLENKIRLKYHLFVQYLFNKQWNQLKNYADKFEIKLIGDLSMYVDYDSADVWANSHLFLLDSNTNKSLFVSGFPASDGYPIQIWNQPIYDWNNINIQQELFSWWIQRLIINFSRVHFLRIDHFRAFISHYRIPIDLNTFKPQISNAQWIQTPGWKFFETLTKSIGNEIPLIVEDLGEVTNEVFQLRDHFQFYGIRILQMGFSTYPDNIYSPHHYIHNSIAYTETHDNATAIEWWNKLASKQEKQQFIEYIQRPFTNDNEFIGNLKFEEHIEKYICWYFIQMTLQSASNGAIILIQDLLSDQTRFNDPSKESSLENSDQQNWSWRFQWSQLTSNIKNQLKKYTQIYGRDLIYGKPIPPKDMIMKNDTSFFQK